MKILFFSVLILGFISGPKNDVDELFPDYSGWEKSTDFEVYEPDNLWDYINGAAEGYLSYHFQDLQMAEYTKNDIFSIRAEVYRHNNPVNAFGIYSQERSPRFDYNSIGAQGYKANGILNFVAGDYYVKMYVNSDKKRALKALHEIAQGIADQIGQGLELPENLNFFPEKGKIDHRESYIAKNFLGHDFLDQAFTARYEIDGEDFQMFIIEKEDKEECKDLLMRYTEFTEQPESIIRENEQTVIEDPYNGDITLVWKDKVIYGIMNTTDQAIIDEYVSSLASHL